MPSLRDCIGKAGKLLHPADGDAMHARAKQYLADGHSVKDAERMAVEHAMSEAHGKLDSIYKQAGVKRAPEAAPAAKVEKPAPAEAPKAETTSSRSSKEVVADIMAKNPHADEDATKMLVGKKNYEVRDVPLSEIGEVFGSKTVQEGVVKKYEGAKSEDPIVLGRVAGSTDTALRAIDGKHRLTAARNRGDKTIKAWVPVEAKAEAKAKPVEKSSPASESKPKTEEPANAISKQSPSEIPVRNEPQSREGVRGENTPDAGASPAREIKQGGDGGERTLREGGNDVGRGKEGNDVGAKAQDENPPAVREEVAPKKSATERMREIEAEAEAAAARETATPTTATEKLTPLEQRKAEIERRRAERLAKESPIAARAATKEPSISQPVNKRFSDRAIETLQKAIDKNKEETKKFVGSELGVAYQHAERAALEIALVGVRTGRAVADVVKLAVARFKAKFPGHTAEDVAKVEASIRAAIENRPPERDPGTAKSKVPESLREVGVPAKDIEYDVRARDERMKEASTLVAKDGAEKAEAMISDRKLPADTRVALGGVLLRDKMAQLANAKPEDAISLTRDIQRIAEATRSGVATESGQGVGMFNRIYQDLALGAGMEYVRKVSERGKNKLGGKESVDAINDATAEINKAKTEQEISAAIDRLKKKHSAKPAKAVLDAFQKKLKTVMELKRIGALSRNDMTEIAGKELGIDQPSPEKLKTISEIGDRIINAKTPAEKAKAEMDLADASEIFKGEGRVDLESGVLAANIFSGYTTQGANASGGLMQTIMQLATLVPSNIHRPSRLKAIAEGAMRGVPEGLKDAGIIMRSGLSTRDFQTTNIAGETRAGTPKKSQIELADYRRMYPGMNKKVAQALNILRIVPSKYIFRFMRAVDATFYHTNKEAYAHLIATKLMEGQFKGKELADMVREKLQTKPEHFLSAQAQAKSEGYDGIDLARRTMDIITERRRSTDVGSTAENRAEQFGRESTFNQDPVGLAGVIYHGMRYMVDETRLGGVPLLKPIAIALRTPTNVFNEIMNYTPVGASRAVFGMRGSGMKSPERLNFNREQREQLFIKSVIGTSIFAAAFTGISNGLLDITADGPEDPNKRRQLQAGGWIPSSIKVGGRRYSFKDTPLAIPLSVMGHVSDAIKYQKPKSDMLLGNQALDALSTSPRVIFDMSMLTGTAAAMDAASGNREGIRKLEGVLGGVPANLIIPYNRLLRQIDQAFDTSTYKTGPVLGAAPLLRRFGEKQMDVQGRPSEYNPLSRFTSRENHDPVDTLLRDKNIFIPEVGKDSKIGNRVMTEDEHTKYRRMSGQRIRARLQIIAPQLRAMNQEDAQKRVEQISREERAKVRPLIGSGAGARN